MQQLFDFRDPQAVAGWNAVDDRVMGGLSQSQLRFDAAGFAVFVGTVSLERNGGFASVRAALNEDCQPGAQHCELEVRSKLASSKRYKLNLITSQRFDGINYQTEFSVQGEEWQRIRLPISGFRASFRGRIVPGAAPLESAHIRQVGLMISDGQAGEFALAIRGIWLA